MRYSKIDDKRECIEISFGDCRGKVIKDEDGIKPCIGYSSVSSQSYSVEERLRKMHPELRQQILSQINPAAKSILESLLE
jgi:hypothetical protein